MAIAVRLDYLISTAFCLKDGRFDEDNLHYLAAWHRRGALRRI
jgi:hypothetical protein